MEEELWQKNYLGKISNGQKCLTHIHSFLRNLLIVFSNNMKSVMYLILTWDIGGGYLDRLKVLLVFDGDILIHQSTLKVHNKDGFHHRLHKYFCVQVSNCHNS